MSKHEISAPSPNEFVMLFSRYSLRIYAYIRTLVLDYEDANDVFQNVSCVLWDKYVECSPIENFFAWARQIAKFEALAHYRKKGSGPRIDELLDVVEDEYLSGSEKLNSRTEALHECLKKLTKEDKALVEARYHCGMQMGEIAENMKLSLASTYRLLSQVHDRLFSCVQRSLAQET